MVEKEKRNTNVSWDNYVHFENLYIPISYTHFNQNMIQFSVAEKAELSYVIIHQSLLELMNIVKNS